MYSTQINKLNYVKCNTFNIDIINNYLYAEFKSFFNIRFHEILNYYIYNENILQQLTKNRYKFL